MNVNINGITTLGKICAAYVVLMQNTWTNNDHIHLVQTMQTTIHKRKWLRHLFKLG